MHTHTADTHKTHDINHPANSRSGANTQHAQATTAVTADVCICSSGRRLSYDTSLFAVPLFHL